MRSMVLLARRRCRIWFQVCFFSKDNNGNILRETAANAGDADFCNANTQQSTRVLSSVITIRRGAPQHTRVKQMVDL